MSSVSKYRSRTIADNLIAFSVSFERDDLLARGMGVEHLRELLIRLARPIVRQGASLAYGGNWRETEDNFTFDLLRLISAEQEDNSLGEPDSNLTIGRLYNHSAWPFYLDVTPRIEAQWINSCRVIRITQQQAGFADRDVVPDAECKEKARDPRTIFNKAVTLSAMRRIMMEGAVIPIPDVPTVESVPPVVARILLGGSLERYSGFVAGILEEALVTLEHDRPTYLLGGFGGAAETLANAILTPGAARPPQLTTAWHREHCDRLGSLLDSTEQFVHPPGFRTTTELLDALFAYVMKARVAPAETLRTGLTDDETRQMLKARDISEAVRLVRTGLTRSRKLPLLPA